MRVCSSLTQSGPGVSSNPPHPTSPLRLTPLQKDTHAYTDHTHALFPHHPSPKSLLVKASAVLCNYFEDTPYRAAFLTPRNPGRCPPYCKCLVGALFCPPRVVSITLHAPTKPKTGTAGISSGHTPGKLRRWHSRINMNYFCWHLSMSVLLAGNSAHSVPGAQDPGHLERGSFRPCPQSAYNPIAGQLWGFGARKGSSELLRWVTGEGTLGLDLRE